MRTRVGRVAVLIVALAACGDESAKELAKAQAAQKQAEAAMRESDAALAAKTAAEASAAQAVKDATQARENLDKVMKELEEIDAKISSAVTVVVDAQTDAARRDASERLKMLQKAQRDVQARVADARAAALSAERQKGMKVSKECLANPLAKGCS